jgi:hypothetical protein
MGHLIELKTKAMPFIAESHALVTDLTPQIKQITVKVNAITAHVEEIAGVARDKAKEFSPTISAANETLISANQTAQEANLKTRAQIKRVDSIISGALDATVRFGVALEKGISTPGREVAGILSGLKVGLNTLFSGARAFGSGSRVSRPYTPPTYPRSNKPNLDM